VEPIAHVNRFKQAQLCSADNEHAVVYIALVMTTPWL
jgi:hypothetical protein